MPCAAEEEGPLRKETEGSRRVSTLALRTLHMLCGQWAIISLPSRLLVGALETDLCKLHFAGADPTATCTLGFDT